MVYLLSCLPMAVVVIRETIHVLSVLSAIRVVDACPLTDVYRTVIRMMTARGTRFVITTCSANYRVEHQRTIPAAADRVLHREDLALEVEEGRDRAEDRVRTDGLVLDQVLVLDPRRQSTD